MEFRLQSNSYSASNSPSSIESGLRSSSDSLSNLPSSKEFGLQVNYDINSNFSTCRTKRNRDHFQPRQKSLPKSIAYHARHFEKSSKNGHTGQGLQSLSSVAPYLLSRSQSNFDSLTNFSPSIESRVQSNSNSLTDSSPSIECRLQSNSDSLTNYSSSIECRSQSNTESIWNSPSSIEFELQSSSDSISNSPSSKESGLGVNSDNSNFFTSNTDGNRYHLMPRNKSLPKAIGYQGWNFEKSPENGHIGQALQSLSSDAPDLSKSRDFEQKSKMDSFLNRDVYQLSYDDNDLFSVIESISSESSISPLSSPQQENDQNVIHGSRTPTKQLSNTVSVKIDGLYSPTKLIPVEFLRNNYFHPLKEKSVKNGGDVKTPLQLRTCEMDIVIVEAGDCGAIRLLKTLVRDSKVGTFTKYSLPFLKYNISYKISLSIKLWHMQEVVNNTAAAKLCPRNLIKRAIVLVYDVTNEDCIGALSVLIAFVVDVIKCKIPIFLVGNTSDLMTYSMTNSGVKKRRRVFEDYYPDYLKNKYYLSGLCEISIESFVEVEALFSNIVNSFF